MTIRVGLVISLFLLGGCALREHESPSSSCSDPLRLYTDARYGVCCDAHDEAYRIGGVEADRLAADQALYLCVRARGNEDDATSMFYAVRWFGKSRFRFKEGTR